MAHRAERFAAWGLAALLLALPAPALGEAPAPKGGVPAPPQPPIHIEADQAEYHSRENRALFTGRVVAVQGDTTLTAERMEVLFTPESESKKADPPRGAAPTPQAVPSPGVPQAVDPAAAQAGIKSLVAIGKVTVRQVDAAGTERYATGERAEYDSGARTVTITGAPRAWENKNVLTGDLMVFSLDNRDVVVRGKAGLTVYPAAGAGPGKDR